MGKIQFIKREQEIILDEVNRDSYLTSNFYFTGGTALSSFYLHHRYSEDIDLFSDQKIEEQVILNTVNKWSQLYNFTFESRFVDVVYGFTLFFDNYTLKLDFAYYPYKQIEKPNKEGNIRIDSLTDIAVNKLLVVSQRSDVKDFVDLYYLLQEFSLWDLRDGVKQKFNVEIEPLLLAADFLKVEDFDFLPKMIKELDIEKLKSFFRQKSKDLSQKSIV